MKVVQRLKQDIKSGAIVPLLGLILTIAVIPFAIYAVYGRQKGLSELQTRVNRFSSEVDRLKQETERMNNEIVRLLPKASSYPILEYNLGGCYIHHR